MYKEKLHRKSISKGMESCPNCSESHHFQFFDVHNHPPFVSTPNEPETKINRILAKSPEIF
jgi:hypothetical protein